MKEKFIIGVPMVLIAVIAYTLVYKRYQPTEQVTVSTASVTPYPTPLASTPAPALVAATSSATPASIWSKEEEQAYFHPSKAQKAAQEAASKAAPRYVDRTGNARFDAAPRYRTGNARSGAAPVAGQGEMLLNAGAVYADSEEDLDTFISMMLHKDAAAAEEMASEGKISRPTAEPLVVTLVTSTIGTVAFRIKGHTRVYWAVREDLSE